jgi:membrane associated rhomboid family serine protease
MARRRPAWQEIERLPLLSVGLALVLLLGFAFVEIVFSERREAAHHTVESAVEFAVKNPSVQIEPRLLPAIRAVLPGFESNEIFSFLSRDQRKKSDKQQAFDQLVWSAFHTLDSHPYRRFGVVPAAPSVLGFAAHPFVHVGWAHLCGALLLLMLAGPVLETLWGRRVLAGVLALASLAGASLFCVVHGGADRALVGAGAPISALVAACVVRFREGEIDWFGWLAPFARVELKAPVWALALVWLLYEATLWVAVPGALPGGVDNAVGYTAHATAALVGGLVALGIARTGLERRLARGPLPVARERARAAPRFDFEEVTRARARGDVDAAFAMLEGEVRRSARNRDVVTTFWEMAIERQMPERAAPAMARLIQEELRRGASEMAVSLWRELAQHSPRTRIELSALLRLVPAIQRIDGDESATVALQQAMDPTAPPPPALAAEVARLAADLEPALALAACECALAGGGLDEAVRSELEAIATRVRKRDEPHFPVPGELPRNAFYEEQDRSGFGEVDDLSRFGSPGESFPRDRVAEAVPVALDESGVFLEVSDAPDVRVDYSAISVVAVGGVRGLGPRPIVLIDLFAASAAAGDAKLRIFRLRGDRFDPRPLTPEADGAMAALRALLARILDESKARPLPGPAAARANPVQMFESLAAYEDAVAARLVS